MVHQSNNNASENRLRPPMGILGGAIFGLCSAILYTATNVALRYCVSLDAFLVSAVKAVPTVVILAPYLLWMRKKKEVIASSFQMVPRFIFAALIGQFVGNAFFQLALGRIGLAVSVPITLGTMIVGAAILGRILLNERVSIRTLLAMVVLLVSIMVLSSPSSHLDLESQNEVAGKIAVSNTAAEIWLGSLFAALSGLAYALFGTTMRQALTGGLSAPLTMFISGSVGAVSLWAVSFYRLGLDVIELIPAEDWSVMAIAGMLNFTAFVALSISLKSLPVIAVNLLNASQVAMAAMAGIVFFAEPITNPLLTGVGLTLIGLLIMVQRKKESDKTKQI